MNTFRIFFGEFWLFFVVTAGLFSLLQWGRRVSLEGNAAVFIYPNSFRELSGFSRDERKRLLHAADREAFPRWRFLFPTLIHAAIFAGSVTLAQALPYSLWVRMGFVVVSLALCCWIARWLEARRIRPFLNLQIKKTHHAEPDTSPNDGSVAPVDNSNGMKGPSSLS
jgi:hypothetical protein